MSEPTIAPCPHCGAETHIWLDDVTGCTRCNFMISTPHFAQYARAARLLVAVEKLDPLRMRVFHEIHLHRNGVFLYNGSGWAGTYSIGDLSDQLIALAETINE